MPKSLGSSSPEDYSGPDSPSQIAKDPLLGRQVGNYLVESVLGRGGFGVVYEAQDMKLGRKVALKFLTNASDDFHSHLFEREAKAIAALSKHPNIVQIYNWDEFEGQNFFALEFVELSAADLLRKSHHGLPWRLAFKIVAECAEALAHAHHSEILHRDIKPANILIEGDDNTAKLADFGLARVRGVSQNTIDGSAIGSPAFMSPEQIRGADMTKLSDIYSLGVTLYQLLCGRTPVEGESHLQTLDMIRNNRGVPLEKRGRDLPPQVCKVVAKATAHDEKKRYQSAEAFAHALRQELAENLEASAATPAFLEKYPAFIKNYRYAIAAVGFLIFSIVFVLVRNMGPTQTEAAPLSAHSAPEEFPLLEDGSYEDEQPTMEKTKEKLEKAGEFVVDKGKNAKDRVKRFFNNHRNRDADDQEELDAEDMED